MPVFNIGAFGQTIRVNFYQDISSGTSFTMELQPQFGTRRGINSLTFPFLESVLKVTATLGTSDVVVDDQKLLANQYIEYTTLSGDLDEPGRWRMKGIAVLPSQTIVTSFQYFRVDP